MSLRTWPFRHGHDVQTRTIAATALVSTAVEKTLDSLSPNLLGPWPSNHPRPALHKVEITMVRYGYIAVSATFGLERPGRDVMCLITRPFWHGHDVRARTIKP